MWSGRSLHEARWNLLEALRDRGGLRRWWLDLCPDQRQRVGPLCPCVYERSGRDVRSVWMPRERGRVRLDVLRGRLQQRRLQRRERLLERHVSLHQLDRLRRQSAL